MRSLGQCYFHINNGGIEISVKYDEEKNYAFFEVIAAHFDCQTNKIIMPISNVGIKTLGDMFIKISEMKLEIKKPAIVQDPDTSIFE